MLATIYTLFYMSPRYRKRLSARARRTLAIAGLGAGALAALPAAPLPTAVLRAQTGGPPTAGNEILVNTNQSGSQTNPDVALAADGRFVVVWESPDGDETGIYAQRFDQTGSPVGTEFRVNDEATGNQILPAVAMEDNGDFAVAWKDSDQNSVEVRRFAADGTPLGTVDDLSGAVTTGDAVIAAPFSAAWSRPSIAMDADGDLVVAVSNANSSVGAVAYHRRPDGTIDPNANDSYPLNGAVYQSRGSGGTYEPPTVAMDADGDYVVVVRAGSLLSSERQPVGAFSTNVTTLPSDGDGEVGVAMDADGDYVVAQQDVGGSGVSFRRYNSSDQAQGGQVSVNSNTFTQYRPATAMDSDGDFSIVSVDNSSPSDVQVDRFLATGTQDGTAADANQSDPAAQNPSLDRVDLGTVVVWQSVRTEPRDGPPGDGLGLEPESSPDIFAIRYDSQGNELASGAVLPVELTAFEAQAVAGGARLTWTTASETGNAGFEVQHERAGGWAAVGWTEGQGTTLETTRYAYPVTGLAPGAHRFRLRQVDLDGASELSSVVEVTVGLEGAVRAGRDRTAPRRRGRPGSASCGASPGGARPPVRPARAPSGDGPRRMGRRGNGVDAGHRRAGERPVRAARRGRRVHGQPDGHRCPLRPAPPTRCARRRPRWGTAAPARPPRCCADWSSGIPATLRRTGCWPSR